MRIRLERLTLIGLSKGRTTFPEEKAQTRHSELESTEMLLIRAYQRDTLNGERLYGFHKMVAHYLQNGFPLLNCSWLITPRFTNRSITRSGQI